MSNGLDPNKKSHQVMGAVLAYSMVGLSMLFDCLPEKWQGWLVERYDLKAER